MVGLSMNLMPQISCSKMAERRWPSLRKWSVSEFGPLPPMVAKSYSLASRSRTDLGTFVIAIGILVALNGCDAGCGNEVASTIKSPRGGHVAVIFNRNCGATTGFNTQISVLAKGDELPNQGGNAFIADGSLVLRVRWVSESELVVTGFQGAKIFKQEKLAGRVSVSYE